MAVVCAASLAANVGLNAANGVLELPFFFDSIGTAVTAATLGLVPGLVVAVATNIAFEIVEGMPLTHLPFSICGVATALIVWWFVRTGRFATLGEALVASIAVALANSVLGALIATYLFGGLTAVGVDYLVTGLVAAGQSILTASFWARVPANLFDKTVAVLVAFVVAGRVNRDRVAGVE